MSAILLILLQTGTTNLQILLTNSKQIDWTEQGSCTKRIETNNDGARKRMRVSVLVFALVAPSVACLVRG
jgi:hypothetical protein